MEAPDGLAVLFNTEETANIWTSAALVMHHAGLHHSLITSFSERSNDASLLGSLWETGSKASFATPGLVAQLKCVSCAGEGRHRKTFAPTPRMSSYLVAFVVGNLTSIEQSVPGGLDPASNHLIRVWGTPDRCAARASTSLKANTLKPD